MSDYPEKDVTIYDHMKLWRCRSVPELRLKCAVLGLDPDRWLRYEGVCWRPVSRPGRFPL